jgi:hypothetical protein
MVTKVVTLYGWGTCMHQNLLWDQTCTWGLHNHRNNECDITSHYYGFIATTSLSVINPIAPNNKYKHQVQPTHH